MTQEKGNFDYWKYLYRSLGITIYLRKPLSPAVFATKSISDLTNAGIYEVRGLRMKLLDAKKDMSEIFFQLSDREGESMIGKAEKGLTLDELIFKSAYYIEEKRDLRVLGVYGAGASVELPRNVISPAALSWKRVNGSDEYFKIIYLFPKLEGNLKTVKVFEAPALA